MKKFSKPFSSFTSWFHRRHQHFLVAGLVASAMVTSLSTFAAESTSNKAKKDGCPPAVARWADSQGWVDNRTYDCTIDRSKHIKDALPGSIAPGKFDSVPEMRKFLRSSDPQAKKLRSVMKKSLGGANSSAYKAWYAAEAYNSKTGAGFVPVQFNRPAKILRDSGINAQGKIVYSSKPRYVKSGDIIFVFVNKGKVNAKGNVRMDCGNINIVYFQPVDKQKRPVKKAKCTKQGTLTVTAFIDSNRNGKRDKNEKVKPNTTFEIKAAGGVTRQTAKTTAKGTFTVSLKAGKYTVTELLTSEQSKLYYAADRSREVNIENCEADKMTFVNRVRKVQPVAVPTPAPETPVQTQVAPETPATPTAAPTPTPAPETPVVATTATPAPTPTPTAKPTPQPTATPVTVVKEEEEDSSAPIKGNGAAVTRVQTAVEELPETGVAGLAAFALFSAIAAGHYGTRAVRSRRKK